MAGLAPLIYSITSTTMLQTALTTNTWPRILFTLCALTGATSAQTSTTFETAVFLLDSQPKTLLGSLVSIQPSTTVFHVDCPTASSPENDACRAEGHYPAELWHSDGSVFGATMPVAATAGSASAPTATTIWTCQLGTGSNDKLRDGYGLCNRTVVAAAAAAAVPSTQVVSTEINSCYYYGHRSPLLVTAGADQINPAHNISVSAFETAQSQILTSLACPMSTTTRTSTTERPSDGSGVVSIATVPNAAAPSRAPWGGGGVVMLGVAGLLAG